MRSLTSSKENSILTKNHSLVNPGKIPSPHVHQVNPRHQLIVCYNTGNILTLARLQAVYVSMACFWSRLILIYSRTLSARPLPKLMSPKLQIALHAVLARICRITGPPICISKPATEPTNVFLRSPTDISTVKLGA